MERVAEAVALSLSLTYTRTDWNAGWNPPRNATRLNNLELQTQENRVALDTIPIPPGITPIYTADFEDGTLNALYSQQEFDASRIAWVGAPLALVGTGSVRFINGTIDNNVAGGHRTESIVQPKISTSFFGGGSLQGKETWISWKYLLDPNYEEPLNAWGLITQFWTNGLETGSPCFALENPRITPNARAQLQVTIRGGTAAASNTRSTIIQNPAVRGVMQKVKVYRLWSTSGTGRTKVWLNNALVLDDTGPNLAVGWEADPEHKCGIYRSASGITRDSYLIVDDINYWPSDPGNL